MLLYNEGKDQFETIPARVVGFPWKGGLSVAPPPAVRGGAGSHSERVRLVAVLSQIGQQTDDSAIRYGRRLAHADTRTLALKIPDALKQVL